VADYQDPVGFLERAYLLTEGIRKLKSGRKRQSGIRDNTSGFDARKRGPQQAHQRNKRAYHPKGSQRKTWRNLERGFYQAEKRDLLNISPSKSTAIEDEIIRNSILQREEKTVL